MWAHRTIVVTAAVRDVAAQICEQLAGSGGSGMFTTPLSPSGNLPATHFVSSGMIEQEFAYLFDYPEMVVELSKGTITLEQVTGILAQADVSMESAFDVFARMGLQICTPEL